jgi:hypothetical protein
MPDTSKPLRSNLCTYFRWLKRKHSGFVLKDKTLKIGRRYEEYLSGVHIFRVRLQPVVLVWRNVEKLWLVLELYVDLCVRTVTGTTAHKQELTVSWWDWNIISNPANILARLVPDKIRKTCEQGLLD